MMDFFALKMDEFRKETRGYMRDGKYSPNPRQGYHWSHNAGEGGGPSTGWFVFFDLGLFSIWVYFRSGSILVLPTPMVFVRCPF